MINNNQNNELYIPSTATVAFYDSETGQNLTLDEWRTLNNDRTPNRIRQNPYRSWKADAEYPSYGPGLDQEMRNEWRAERRSKEESQLKDKKSRAETENYNYCIIDNCWTKIEKSEKLCKYHKDESDQEDQWIKWGAKTIATSVATAICPVGTAITGVVSWGTGQFVKSISDTEEDKKIAQSVSNFGSEILRGKLLGEVTGLIGGDAGGNICSVFSMGWEAKKHQDHISQGISYKADCPVCK